MQQTFNELQAQLEQLQNQLESTQGELKLLRIEKSRSHFIKKSLSAHWMRWAVVSVFCFAFGYLVHSVEAQPPAGSSANTMWYSGFLKDKSGKPVSGTRTFTVSFYKSKSLSDKTTLCTKEYKDETVRGGYFRVKLLDACVKAVQTNPSIWVGVKIGTEDELPRTQLGSVPYAISSRHAHSPFTIGNVASDAGQWTIKTGVFKGSGSTRVYKLIFSHSKVPTGSFALEASDSNVCLVNLKYRADRSYARSYSCANGFTAQYNKPGTSSSSSSFNYSALTTSNIVAKKITIIDPNDPKKKNWVISADSDSNNAKLRFYTPGWFGADMYMFIAKQKANMAFRHGTGTSHAY